MQKSDAIKLRKNGLSVNQIAQKLGVSKGSVSPWVRLVVIPKTKRKNIQKRILAGGQKGRKKILLKWKEYRRLHPKPTPYVKPIRKIDTFFDTWTPDMAYVLGYFAADGTMYRNRRGSCYVAFTSTDLELLETVKKILFVSNEIEVYKLKNPRCKLRYTLQIGSKKAFDRLIKLGLVPKKSLVLRLPKIPDMLFCHFLRGNLDGDGCVFFARYRRKRRQGIYTVLRVTFTSGSKVFLEAMQEQLFRIGVTNGGRIYSIFQNHHVLLFSATNSRLLYNFMYPNEQVPCLKRKKDVFREAFRNWTRSSVG